MAWEKKIVMITLEIRTTAGTRNSPKPLRIT